MYERKKLYVILYLLPVLLLFTVNVVFSGAMSFVYSFVKWDGISKMKFAGFDNYIAMVHDPIFFKSLLDSFYLVLASGVVQVAVGLVLAVLLMDKVRGYKIFRSVFFFPVTLSSVAVALMFSLIYSPDFGLLNSVLRGIGLGQLARPWLDNGHSAIFLAIIPQTWQFVGLMFVILLAGLQNIPAELMECAELDGARGLKKTWYVTVPLIWEVIQICIILGVTGALQAFDHINILTGGGPMHMTEILGNYMWMVAFKALSFGYGMTISTVIFVLGFTFTVIFKKYFSGETVQY